MAEKITAHTKVRHMVPDGYELFGEFKIHYNPEVLEEGMIVVPIRKKKAEPLIKRV